MHLRDILLTALAPIFWGSTYLVATELLPPGRPLLAGALRALPIGLLMVAASRQLPRGIWWVRSLLLGGLNIGLFFALLFVAAYRLPGGVAAMMGALQPLVAALLAWLLLRERPSAFLFGAAAAGVAGVTLIVVGPAARLDAVGVAAALAATLAMALATVLTRRWGRPVPLPVFTAWQLAAGGLMLTLMTLALEGAPPALTLRNLGGAAYLGLVGTGVAYGLWLRGVERIGTAASFLLLLSPVVACILGYAVLNQTLTPTQLGGIALVLGTVLFGQRFAQRPVLRPAGGGAGPLPTRPFGSPGPEPGPAGRTPAWSAPAAASASPSPGMAPHR